jgi:hypothetical protein
VPGQIWSRPDLLSSSSVIYLRQRWSLTADQRRQHDCTWLPGAGVQCGKLRQRRGLLSSGCGTWSQARQEAARLQALACRLQAAARGFLARRQARQAAARLQATVRCSLAQQLASILRVQQHATHRAARPSAELADPAIQLTVLIHSHVDSKNTPVWVAVSTGSLELAVAQAVGLVSCHVRAFAAWTRLFPWHPGGQPWHMLGSLFYLQIN